MKRWRWVSFFVAAVVLSLAFAAFWLTQPGVVPSANNGGDTAEEARLRKHVEFLAGPLAKRDHAHVGTLNRAAAYIQQGFAEAGGRVSVQAFDVDGFRYSNIVARFGPAEGSPLIVGAHYDVNAGTPGADDNASGVAGLLEVARLLGKSVPAAPVELVAYTLEEPPYFRSEQMGSWHHAHDLVSRGVQPQLVLVLEMIGYFSDAPDSQSFPVPLLGMLYPERGNFIAVVGHAGNVGIVRRVKAAMSAASLLPVRSINAPAWLPGVDFSDHASYWLHGIPAVMVTDTSFYRNPNYHEPDDRPETLDYRRMAMVVDGVASVLRNFAVQADSKKIQTNKEKQ